MLGRSALRRRCLGGSRSLSCSSPALSRFPTLIHSPRRRNWGAGTRCACRGAPQRLLQPCHVPGASEGSRDVTCSWGAVVPLFPWRRTSHMEEPAPCPRGCSRIPGEPGLPGRSRGMSQVFVEGWDNPETPLGFVLHQEIDRRLEKKLKITQKERKSKSPPKVPIVIQDDSLPAGPPPQIRILKRPTTNGVLSSPHSASRPAFPVKSLAQREAEYAEARKRILGSASPEEEQEKPILDRPPRISQPEDTRQPNNVIRQPLGPDGSQGFKQRR
ncbi:SUZ domain-containing protein 1 isoform X2 [Prinia subflava]|uniref:SUZ domain-containing protein 1 isoform X2 n=1 Tax=Prinia subflava TaxID=208062 RepID=UPI002FDF7C84